MTRSLRARLLAGLVLLVAAGLLVSAASTYIALSTFVGNRLMDQLNGDRAAAQAPDGDAEASVGRNDIKDAPSAPRVVDALIWWMESRADPPLTPA